MSMALFCQRGIQKPILLSANAASHLSILGRKICIDWVIIREKAAYGKVRASDKNVCFDNTFSFQLLLLPERRMPPDSLISNNKSCALHISYTSTVRLRSLVSWKKRLSLKNKFTPMRFLICVSMSLSHK